MTWQLESKISGHTAEVEHRCGNVKSAQIQQTHIMYAFYKLVYAAGYKVRTQYL